MKTANSSKHKDFFKDHQEFEREIRSFLNRYDSVFTQSSDQTHALFEMSMLDGIVKFFEKNHFQIKVKNPKSKQFVFALSSNANPNNTSFFSVVRKVGQQEYHYEIRHNVKVQSSHYNRIFFSPDYIVCKANSLKQESIDWYYAGKYPLHFIQSMDVMTFAEAKNYIPSPELVINFIGIINEFAPYLIDKSSIPVRYVFTPTLFISGKGNAHLQIIKESLRSRYKINILFGMFSFPTQLHSDYSEDDIETF